MKPKAEWHVLPFDVLEGALDVCVYGNEKHGADSWRDKAGDLADQADYFDKVMRHLLAWRSGQTNDLDSDLHPLDHALVDLMILRGFTLREEE